MGNLCTILTKYPTTLCLSDMHLKEETEGGRGGQELMNLTAGKSDPRLEASLMTVPWVKPGKVSPIPV